jgi:hypothetical protein
MGERLFSVNRKLVVACIVFTSLVILAAAPLSVRAESKTMTAQNVVCIEKFTGTWCTPCGNIATTVDSLWTNYGPGQIALIEYHVNQSVSQTDPYATDPSSGRESYYALSSVPSLVFDGSNALSGENDYSAYQAKIDARLGIAKNFALSVSGDVTTGSVSVHLEQTGTATGSNVYMRYRILESELYYDGSPSTDPDKTYQHVSRLHVTPTDQVTLPMSSAKDFTKTFKIDSSWNKQKLSFVAFLQNDDTKEIYQTCYFGYDGQSVPEISPLFIIPIGGLFIALYAIAIRRKSN